MIAQIMNFRVHYYVSLLARGRADKFKLISRKNIVACGRKQMRERRVSQTLDVRSVERKYIQESSNTRNTTIGLCQCAIESAASEVTFTTAVTRCWKAQVVLEKGASQSCLHRCKTHGEAHGQARTCFISASDISGKVKRKKTSP